ncbi:MAG: choice-of-anchor D domain-containing protein [Cyclobacteriaceae bacterium]|nr:choice-of-anchor D domain-containing protein [Cyclobacteriaceae bacterium]
MKIKGLIFGFIIYLSLFSIQAQTIYTVTSTADNGSAGTLRYYVNNATSAGDQINFDNSLSGLTISLTDTLLIVKNNLTINGDINGDQVPDITIGSSSSVDGIVIKGSSNTLSYLHLVEFNSGGNATISLDGAGATNNTIRGCYIGTNATATGVSGTAGNLRGIEVINGASSNNIGDGSVAGRNIISNNAVGIYISASNNNSILGNYIGTDISGVSAIQNTGPGISIINSTGNNIGGNSTGQGNVISGNNWEGISISSGSSDTRILGNLIGTDASGTIDLGNGRDGIFIESESGSTIIGDGTAGGRNIISGNGNQGIELNNSSDNILLGNYIGLDVNGVSALGNTSDGIYLFNGSTNNSFGDGTAAGRNIISGNGNHGMRMASGTNSVTGNYIGTDAGGTTAIGNAGFGIFITGGTAHKIGGTNAGEGNLISGNITGIGIGSSVGNEVLGNYIGTDLTGLLPVANTNEGIRISVGQNSKIGDGTASGRNVISGNSADGILITGSSSTGNLISDNYIGLGSDGITTLGNGANGVLIESNANTNTIGLNTITANSGDGIKIDGLAAAGTLDNILTQNSIFSNTGAGTTVANGAQNGVSPPIITTQATNGTVAGTGTPGATIEVFADPADEGKDYLGSTLVDGAGNWSLVIDPADISGGSPYATATQTVEANTSAFSDPLLLDLSFIVVNTNDSGGGSLRWVIENANGVAGASSVIFDIPNTDPGYSINGAEERWTISPLTDLPDIVKPLVLDAANQPGTGNYKIKIDGGGTLDDGFYATATVEIYGFYITGFRAVNGSTGIYLTGAAANSKVGASGKGNVINNCGQAIYVTLADWIEIKGNLIGTDETGVAAISNGTGINFPSNSGGNTVGGDLPGERNIISGSTGNGINVNAGGAQTIIGNYIGTDITGLVALPNGEGLQFGTSGSNVVRNNVISGNTGNGIELVFTSNSTYQGNFIGVGADGITPLPNNIGFMTTGTINIDNNLIGGTGAGEGNIIAHNTNQGVWIRHSSFDFNQITGNRIFCNGGLGIDLNLDNAFSQFGNDGKAAPVITGFDATSVSGTGVDGDVVHVYRDNSGCLPLQGAEYLGSTVVNTGLWTLGGLTLDPINDLINATATDASGNTSEFANNYGEIAVFLGSDNTGTEITDGQASAADMGSFYIGTDGEQLITIENLSQVPLTISEIKITGTDFTLANVPLLVAPLSTSTFSVHFSGSVAGTFSATLTITNDDTDEAVFDFPISGSILPGSDIAAFDGPDNLGAEIFNGQLTVVDLGTSTLGNDLIYSITIDSKGTTDLGVEIISSASPSFNIANTPTIITVGNQATFTITLSGAVLGTFNTDISIFSDDPDESTFVFPVTGNIIDPEIAVYQGPDVSGTEIFDGQITPVDMGSSLVGNDIIYDITIQNTGSSPLNISTITSSLPNFSIAGVPAVVNAGGSATFTITLSGTSSGFFNTTLTINSDDADEAVFDFPLTGTITAPEIVLFLGSDNTGVEVTDGQATAVNIGSSIQGTDLNYDLTIENKGNSQLTITGISFSDPAYSVVAGPTLLNAGATATFTVTLNSSKAGIFNTTVTINSDDADEAIFDFPLTGLITAPEIALFQGAENTGIEITDGQAGIINLGSTPLGSDLAYSFTIENPGNALLTLSSSVSSSVDFILNNVPASVSAGATSTFTVIMSGVSPGTYNATITLNSNDSDEAVFEFQVMGTVVAPEIALFQGTANTGIEITDGQPGIINLGSTPLGSDLAFNITIENQGNAMLILSSSVSSSVDFTLNNVPASVAAGATSTFTLIMSGASPGTFSATITLNSNDSDEAVFDFQVSGLVTAPEFVLYEGKDLSGTAVFAGQTVHMGTIPEGTPLVYSMTIGNTGTDVLTITSFTVSDAQFSVAASGGDVPSGGILTFDIILDGSQPGTFTSDIAIASNDVDEADFIFSVTGIIEPETQYIVKENDATGVVISLGEPVDVGTTPPDVGLQKSFILENPGSQDITITSITVDNSVFVIENVPTVLGSGGIEEFVIMLRTNRIGYYEGQVTISTSSGDFSFLVTGEVIDIEIFNAVTPDGDGLHDFLKIARAEFFNDNHLVIYTRWGDKVYEISGYNNSDKAFNGASNVGSQRDLLNGTYYYVFRYHYTDDNSNPVKRALSGFFLLRR